MNTDTTILLALILCVSACAYDAKADGMPDGSIPIIFVDSILR